MIIQYRSFNKYSSYISSDILILYFDDILILLDW